MKRSRQFLRDMDLRSRRPLLDAAVLAPDSRFKNVGLAIQAALNEITEQFKLTEADQILNDYRIVWGRGFSRGPSLARNRKIYKPALPVTRREQNCSRDNLPKCLRLRRRYPIQIMALHHPQRGAVPELRSGPRGRPEMRIVHRREFFCFSILLFEDGLKPFDQ